MSGYRPITDVWLLGRPKVKYYGSYPSGYLERARQLLGVQRDDPVLHVCGGKVRDYPFAGFGPDDKTLDLDPELKPNFLMDARSIEPGAPAFQGYRAGEVLWPAVLVDRPYSPDDADHYVPGRDKLPEPNDLLKRCLSIVRPGGRVGFLDYYLPRPPRAARFVACVMVVMGYGNRARVYSVFERDATTPEERQRALDAVRGKAPQPLVGPADDPGQTTWVPDSDHVPVDDGPSS